MEIGDKLYCRELPAESPHWSLKDGFKVGKLYTITDKEYNNIKLNKVWFGIDYAKRFFIPIKESRLLKLKKLNDSRR